MEDKIKTAVICFPKILDSPWEKPQFPTGIYKIREFCRLRYEVLILDERIEENFDEALEDILEHKKVLCLGISTMTGTQIKSAIRIAKKFQREGLPIVWGGIHPTICPESTIAESYVDYVIRGDGERAFLELLDFLDGRSSSGVSFLSKVNYNIHTINCFDELDRSDIDFNELHIPKEYIIERDGFKRAFAIETSRGCPHRCAFCHNTILGHNYRTIRTQKILRTIDILINTYGIDGIIFQEDNFFCHIDRVKEMVNALKKKKIGWKANSRINYFTKLVDDVEFMNNLVDSGCRTLQFGIESGTERIIKLINKRIDLNDVVEVNRKMSNYNIKIRYNFIIGFPTETIQEMENTINLAKRLQCENKNVESPFVNIYTPYPGTPIYDMAVKSGFVSPSTLEEWADLRWNEVSNMIKDDRIKESIYALSNYYLSNSSYLKARIHNEEII